MKRISFRIGFILVGFALSLAAKAEAAAPPGQSWPTILHRLQSLGVTKVGSLDLRTFEQRAQSELHWQVMDEASTRPAFAERRRSAYFEIHDHTISESSAILKTDREALALLELHEALGALKYNDRYYSLSTSLNVISQFENDRDREDLVKNLGRTYFNRQYAMAGSGTSVGGGGDEIALMAKVRVLQAVLKDRDATTWDFLRVYPGIGFEPLYKREEQQVSLRYQARPRNYRRFNLKPLPGVPFDKKGGYQELISVYVPALLWNRGTREQNKIVQQIKDYLVDLFPVYDLTAYSNYVGLACNSRFHLRFPRAKTSAAATIQEVRTALLTNCDPDYFTDEVRVPSFKEFVPPPQKGETRYQCHWEIDGAKSAPTIAQGVAGRKSSQIIGTSGPADAGGIDLLSAFLIFDAHRSITDMMLTETRTNSKKLIRAKRHFPSVAASARVSLRGLSGNNIGYVCNKE